jgi:hypothetical protein
MDACSYRHYFHGRSAGIRHRVECERIEKEKKAELRRREEKAYFTRVSAMITADLGDAAKHWPFILVPRNYRDTSILPEDRKDDFRDFLTALIRETLASSEDSTNDADAADYSRYDSLQNACPGEELLCAVCKGACCNNGWHDAYIRKETILRYIANFPATHPDAVTRAYMANMADRAYEGSCVYHTEQGCCLPREMRSDTCVGFRCESQVELHRLFDNGDAPEVVVLIERMYSGWRKKPAKGCTYRPYRLLRLSGQVPVLEEIK